MSMPRNSQLSLEEALLAENNLSAQQAFSRKQEYAQRASMQAQMRPVYAPQQQVQAQRAQQARQAQAQAILLAALRDEPVFEQPDNMRQLAEFAGQIAQLERENAALRATQQPQRPAPVVSVPFSVIDTEDARSPAFDASGLKRVVGTDE